VDNLRQVTLLVVRAVTEGAVAVRIETVVERQLLVVKAAMEPCFFITQKDIDYEMGMD